MQLRLLFCIIALVTLFSGAATAQNAVFGDVPREHWAFNEVYNLWVGGIAAGCQAAPPLFCPDAYITRAEAAVLIDHARIQAIHIALSNQMTILSIMLCQRADGALVYCHSQ